MRGRFSQITKKMQLLAWNSFSSIECKAQTLMENVAWKCSVELRSKEMKRVHTHTQTHFLLKLS